MYVDICEERDKKFGRDVVNAALAIDPDGTRAIEGRIQQEWDDGLSRLGEGIIYDTMREEDSEREIEGFVDYLQDELEMIVHDKWMIRLSRDDVLSICRILEKSQLAAELPPTFSPCPGMAYTAREIMMDWNDIFPILFISEDDILPRADGS